MRQLLQNQQGQEGQPEVPTADPHRYAEALEAAVEETPSVTLTSAEKRKLEPGADPPAMVVNSASEVQVPWQRPGAAPQGAGAARTGPSSGQRWVLLLLSEKAV